MNKHKPNCSSNIHCAVYHANGVCPGYKPCDCGVEKPKKEITAPTPKVSEHWEKELDRIFGYTDTQYEPPQRRMNSVEVDRVLAFIRQVKTEATQRGRDEVIGSLDEVITSVDADNETTYELMDKIIKWRLKSIKDNES